MVNVNLLRSKIILSGYTQKKLSQLLSMSEATFSNKINNKTAFYVDEIDILCEVLKITSCQEKIDIFLDD